MSSKLLLFLPGSLDCSSQMFREGVGAGKKGGLRGERWWRRAGRCGVDVVEVGVRCVKGKGEMRHKFSQSSLHIDFT